MSSATSCYGNSFYVDLSAKTVITAGQSSKIKGTASDDCVLIQLPAEPPGLTKHFGVSQGLPVGWVRFIREVITRFGHVYSSLLRSRSDLFIHPPIILTYGLEIPRPIINRFEINVVFN